MTTTYASYTKLRDGSWGVRAPGKATAGTVLTVRKSSGEMKDEIVDKVLWTGADSRTGEQVSLCSIRVRGASRSASGSTRSGGRGGRRYVCEECGDWVEPGTACWETGMTH